MSKYISVPEACKILERGTQTVLNLIKNEKLVIKTLTGTSYKSPFDLSTFSPEKKEFMNDVVKFYRMKKKENSNKNARLITLDRFSDGKYSLSDGTIRNWDRIVPGFKCDAPGCGGYEILLQSVSDYQSQMPAKKEGTLVRVGMSHSEFIHLRLTVDERAEAFRKFSECKNPRAAFL